MDARANVSIGTLWRAFDATCCRNLIADAERDFVRMTYYAGAFAAMIVLVNGLDHDPYDEGVIASILHELHDFQARTNHGGQ